MIQMGQYASHVWPFTSIGQPTLLNDSPQPLGEPKVLCPLRFPWSVAVQDCVYHRPFIRNVPVRNIPTKNLTVLKSDISKSGNDRIHTNLVYNHPKSVTVGLLGWSVITDPVLLWIE